MRRRRFRLLTVCVAMAVGLIPAVMAESPAPALVNPSIPWLTLNRTISSQPWAASATFAGDLGGAAYSPFDASLWVVDAKADAAYELNATTGALRRTLALAAFATAPKYGGGPAAGAARADNFQSVAMDVAKDTLYVFSGNCCGVAPFYPTVFRLTRDGANKFQVDSYQPLPEGTDPAAASVVLGGPLYFGKNQRVRTYDYATNVIGPANTVIGITGGIQGMSFADPGTLMVSTTANQIVKLDTSNWLAVPGWTFDLARYGILDPTDMQVIGDQFFVTDGNDTRAKTDPLRHAIFVLDLAPAPPVTAKFTPHVTRGSSPLTVFFTDHSVRADTHAWDFGDGTASSEVSPAHTFTTPGDIPVTLTVTGVGGADASTQVIHVLPATARTGGYTLDGFGGLHPFRIGATATAPSVSDSAYWPNWDIARGVAVLPDGSGGYTLDGFGGLHPFRVGTGGTPPNPGAGPYWKGWDAARGVALMPNGHGGYVVDLFGGIHRFRIGASALPPAPRGGPYWNGDDRARGITVLPGGTGGYVVDRDGNLHAFAIGANAPPPAPTSVWSAMPGRPVHGVSLLGTGVGGYTVDGTGRVHGFVVLSAPPGVRDVTIWPTWDIVRDLVVLPGN